METDYDFQNAINGDVYLEPKSGLLWMYEEGCLLKINLGSSIDIEDTERFIKVGHIRDIDFKII